MKVVVTLQYIMGQLITFCVPLIIIGFIAPSITKLGKNASRLLGVAIVIAYVSSVCAALMSTGAGYALIPHLSIDTEVAGLRTLPDVVFELNIPITLFVDICNYLNVTPDYLMLGNMRGNRASIDIIDELKMCSSEEIATVKKIVDAFVLKKTEPY